MANRGLNKRARGRELHEKHIQQHQQVATVSEDRALNRPSHQRHAERLRAGHDVISNHDFSGRDGRPPPLPRAQPPVSVWERLASQGTGEGVGAGAETEAGKQGTGRVQDLASGGTADRVARSSIDSDTRGGGAGGTEGSGSERGSGVTKSGQQRGGVDGRSGGRSASGGDRGSNGQGDEGKGGREMVATAKQYIVPPLDLSRRPDDGDSD